jgi:hypothetical protein
MSLIGLYKWTDINRPEYKILDTDKKYTDISYYNNLGYETFDPNQKNVILIFFKSGSGGLFLGNCLSLSDNFLCKYRDIDEKLNFLKKSIRSQQVFWNDIYLSSIVDYGDAENKDKYSLVYDHNFKTIKYHLKYWKNLNIIYFKNPDLFCKVRRVLKNFDGYISHTSSEKIKRIDTEELPTSIENYRLCSEEQQKFWKNTYCGDDNLHPFSFLKNKKLFYTWDTNWYFSEEDTVSHIKELYELFNLSGFNSEAIKEYYSEWIKKIDHLRTIDFNSITHLSEDKSTFDKNIF